MIKRGLRGMRRQQKKKEKNAYNKLLVIYNINILQQEYNKNDII